MGKDKVKEDPEKEARRKEIEQQKAEKKLKEKGTEKTKEKRAEQIVRFLETDLDGNLTLSKGIRQIKGVSFMFANAISHVCPFAEKRIGDLSEIEINQLEEMITNPLKFNLPPWITNRRRDPETNQTYHLIVSQLDLVKNTDINKMKKMKSYKGIRHSYGLPVRGQRTKSSGRKKGSTVGVSRKKETPGAAPAAGAKK